MCVCVCVFNKIISFISQFNGIVDLTQRFVGRKISSEK